MVDRIGGADADGVDRVQAQHLAVIPEDVRDAEVPLHDR